MKRLLSLVLITLFVVSSFAYTFYNPVGPALYPAAGLFNSKPDGLQLNYWRNLDEVQTIAVKNSADFLVLPVAFGAQLISKGANYKLVGVSLWKSFYLVTSLKLNTIEELEGKRVVTLHGPGQTADLVLKMLQKEKNMKFEIQYVNNAADIVQLLATGKETIAVLPEPYVSLAEKNTKGKVKMRFDMQNIYANITKLPSVMPITGLFVLKTVPKDIEDKYVKMYSDSANIYYKKNYAKAVDFVFNSFAGKMPKDVIKNASKNSTIVFRNDKKAVMEYLQILFKYGLIDSIPQNIF